MLIQPLTNSCYAHDAGRASPAILDRVMVDYMGVPTPLKSMANVKTSTASQLIVEAYDRSTLTAIERGIIDSGVGLTPNNDGSVIRLNIPAVTEDRRKELCKEAKAVGEEGKVSIRNVRRDVVDAIKKAEKSKEISQDASKNASADIQKVTDKYAKQVEDMVAAKEKEIMTI
jgi:ribosome recycling factor